ncbi:MAG: hypothetical protein IJU05_01415, partial [Schwartzia sp.]|nr:hypothetical protein [Schwartzia sp. (in: firmicutes)]
NFWEYTDLNSCTIAEETDEYYELAVGYVRRSRVEGTPYYVRYFRYYKDGVTRPEYYVEKTDKWIVLPLQDKETRDAYWKEHPAYQPFRAHFHPDQFHMLQVACRQLFGIELKG